MVTSRWLFVVGLLGSPFLWASLLEATPAAGPLSVHPTNPRYFTDGSGKAVYLTGSHVWNNFQDWGYTDPPPQLSYTDYLNNLTQHNHNFIRGWAWEQAKYFPGFPDFYITPHPFSRSGPGTALDGKPKFDLNSFNQAYFDRIRSRIMEAGNNGIYVSVMLFEGFSVELKGKTTGNPWIGHPFNVNNNINGINGDADGDGEGKEVHTGSIPAIVSIQQAYIRKLVDTLNDLDNVLYEISNESHADSQDWQYSMINYIKSYQSGKPKQHPVGMTVEYPNPSNSELFNSPADWISPSVVAIDGSFYTTNPLASSGDKVMILDTDHLGLIATVTWAFKSFARGHNTAFMDPKFGTVPDKYPDKPEYEAFRNALGYTRSYAERMDLAAMIPQNGGSSPSSTGYCLYNSGKEYFVYQPGTGAFTLALPAGTYAYEWFNPDTGSVASSGIDTWSGGDRTFTPPFSGDAALYLGPVPPVASIDASPTNGVLPLLVNFDGSDSYDADGTIVTYAWDFDNDGTVDSNDMITSHAYSSKGDYLASLTVTDNDGLTNSVSVEIAVMPQPGDFDDDLDVDQEDFGRFQACLTGIAVPVTDPNCLYADLEGDNDVDQGDFAIFLRCLSGASVPADPACAG